MLEPAMEEEEEEEEEELEPTIEPTASGNNSLSLLCFIEYRNADVG